MESTDKARQTERKLERIKVLLDEDLVTAIESYAHSTEKSRTGAISALVTKALRDLAIEGLDELWENSGAERRIEEVHEQVEDLFALAQATARRTFSTHRLLIHWVTSAGTLQVSEDELRAEIRAAGEDAVQQLLDELREPEGTPDPEDEEADDDPGEPPERS
jgi:hypothetical protein